MPEIMVKKMPKTIFETRLLKDGHLYCPKKFARSGAKFKVIVSLPDEEPDDETFETASVTDLSADGLTEEEIDYYMQLDEK